MKASKEWIEKLFVVCPICGYNNEKKRFSLYGRCLRCHEIIDKKIYLKRLMWEAKNERREKRENKKCGIY